jgi:5-methylcytosine-specific restriction endonuclease McrA
MPEITTVGEWLHWSYANLAMAHAAVENGATTYSRAHFIIRSRLYKGLTNQTMQIGSFLNDERLKMTLPRACSYCGCAENLSVDHLMPKARGGLDRPENLVWACKSCNSAKRDRDLLLWYNTQGKFPPLMLLRRYLKIAIEICMSLDVMAHGLDAAPEMPFELRLVPQSYPRPSELVLWVSPLKE